MKVKQVCVIGAGISGLASAKVFLEEGYEVTVFEKQQGLGGVWEKSRTYPELATQNPRDTYAFSDYPMPSSYPEWPSAEQVRTYLESYANHFGVTKNIKFGAEVIKVERKGKDSLGWVVRVKFKNSNQETVFEEKYKFDFIIICNGMFNIPNVPNFPGIDKFIASGGKVLHSSNFNDESLIAGKRVVVVGFGKSAIDIAAFAANKAKECTLVFRQALWKVPKFFLGFINIKYVLITRFAESWIPYYKLKGWENFLHTIGKPLVKTFWKINETILRLQFPIDAYGLRPDLPLNKVFGCRIGLVPEKFFKYVQVGKISLIKATINKFFDGGIELSNGQELEADIVLFGTGFRQGVPFLEDKYRQYVFDKQNFLHLYRYLIHPEVPQMGFVGYYFSICSQLTSEIGARWLVEYVKENLDLPSKEKMLEDIITELEWRKKDMPYAFLNGTCMTPFTFHYIDELMQDMGLETCRKSKFRIIDMLMPADPSNYKNIRQKLQCKNIL